MWSQPCGPHSNGFMGLTQHHNAYVSSEIYYSFGLFLRLLCICITHIEMYLIYLAVFHVENSGKGNERQWDEKDTNTKQHETRMSPLSSIHKSLNRFI